MSDSVEKMDSTEQQPPPTTTNENGSSENMADVSVVDEPVKKELEAVSTISEQPTATEEVVADTNGGLGVGQDGQNETKEELLMKEEKMDASSVKSDQQQVLFTLNDLN
jgi:hypothetical protein